MGNPNSKKRKKREDWKVGATGFKPESNQRGQWVTEDEEEIISDGNVVASFLELRGSVAYSAMWIDEDLEKQGAKYGEFYWIIEFGTIENGAWVGVTSRDRLKQDWATRALFWEQSLANGDRRLVDDFGPEIKSRDVVGILVEFKTYDRYYYRDYWHDYWELYWRDYYRHLHYKHKNEVEYGYYEHPLPLPKHPFHPFNHKYWYTYDKEELTRLKVYFYLNGEPLGLAYDVPAKIFPNGIHPIVRFNKGKANCRIRRVHRITDFPKERFRARKYYKDPTIEGAWVPIKHTIGNDGTPFDYNDYWDRITLKIEAKGDPEIGTRFKLILRCVNYINIYVTCKGRELLTAKQRAQKWQPWRWHQRTEWGHWRWNWKWWWNWTWISDGDSNTTYETGADELMRLEDYFCCLLDQPNSVVLEWDRIWGRWHMKIIGTNGESKATFQRYDDTPPPFLGNPFK